MLLGLGLVVAAAVAAYRFVQANRDAIIAFCVAAGAVLLLAYFVRFLFRSARAVPERNPLPVAGSSSSQAHRGTPLPKPNADARWIAPTETVTIGKTVVSGGLFYLGGRLGLGDGTTGQYVVNPTLPLKAPPDVDGGSMPYWPSYAEITPSARRAFIDWLASGRKSRAYGIGHVFLYFYGLEHRFFVDADQTDDAAIYWEVDRLLKLYGDNDSFRGYATAFLDMAKVSRGARLELPELSPHRALGAEVHLAVRMHLGARLADAGVLLAEDALMWLLAEPNTALRTPAVRCFDEFVALWRERFGKRYPNGIAPKTDVRIRLDYRAASGAFEISVPGPHEQLPDVGAMSGVAAELLQFAQSCTDELESFSRLVGRKPAARHSMAGVALLPPELQVTDTSEVVAKFKSDVNVLIGSRGSANPMARTVFDLAGIEVGDDGKITAANADELGRALDRVDVAIEPDRRFGSGVPRADEQILLFSAPGGGPVDAERASYRMMRLLIEVAILAASADGQITDEEVTRTITQIREAPDLSRIERARLIAYTALTFKSPPKQARVKARLRELPEAERKAIAEASIAVVGGDTKNAGDVKFLEKLYKVLGLPREEVYVAVHRAAAHPDEPVSVGAEVRVSGIPIPRQEPAKAPGKSPVIKIDPALLARRRKETDAASKILSSIFAEEEPAEPAQSPSSPSGHEAMPGLDSSHAELVVLLRSRGSMSRVEFDGHARAMKLLPDGAIERINDWSHDQFEEPLIEDGDELVVPPHLLARIDEMRKSP